MKNLVLIAAGITAVTQPVIGEWFDFEWDFTDFAYLNAPIELEPLPRDAEVEVLKEKPERGYEPVAFITAHSIRGWVPEPVSGAEILEMLKLSARNAGCPAIINVVIEGYSGKPKALTDKAGRMRGRATGVIWVEGVPAVSERGLDTRVVRLRPGDFEVFAETPLRPFKPVTELSVTKMGVSLNDQVATYDIIVLLKERARREGCTAIMDVVIEDFIGEVFDWKHLLSDRTLTDLVNAKRGKATGIVWVEEPEAAPEPATPDEAGDPLGE